MTVYQKKGASVKGGIEMIDYGSLYQKAREGLLELAVSLGLEAVGMMLAADVERAARGPRASTTRQSA
jgi:hypothetical protein